MPMEPNDFPVKETIEGIDHYWVKTVDNEEEQRFGVQLANWHNADYSSGFGGWATVVLRLQFIKADDGKFYLLNWRIFAGGSGHNTSEEERVRSVLQYGAQLYDKTAFWWMPGLPREMHHA